MKDNEYWEKNVNIGNLSPIKPEEVIHKIPDFVIKAVNELIQKKWDGEQAYIKQDEIMDIISSDDEEDPRPSRQFIFDKHWLDIEDTYRKAGWNVEYDKPGYCENYDAYFVFSKF